MTAAETVTVRKELGVSHGDFFRVLPRVLEGRPCEIDGARIVVDEASRRLEIRISDERQRRLGPLVSLPVTHVELSFTGYGEADRRAFLEVFDLNFFKGGG